jgi:hypothetical protein
MEYMWHLGEMWKHPVYEEDKGKERFIHAGPSVMLGKKAL